VDEWRYVGNYCFRDLRTLRTANGKNCRDWEFQGFRIFVGVEGVQFSRDVEVGSSFNSRDFTVGEF
jgi:hypothetical protein